MVSMEQCPARPQALPHSNGFGPCCLPLQAMMRACCLLPRLTTMACQNRSVGICVSDAIGGGPSIAFEFAMHHQLVSVATSSPVGQERKAFAIRRSLEHNLALQERLRGMLASMDRSQQTNADLRSQVDALRKHHKPHRNAGALRAIPGHHALLNTTMHRRSSCARSSAHSKWQRFRQRSRHLLL